MTNLPHFGPNKGFPENFKTITFYKILNAKKLNFKKLREKFKNVNFGPKPWAQFEFFSKNGLCHFCVS